MKSGSEYRKSIPYSILLVGDPKTGKTRTLFSFPDPWILDVDRNLFSATRLNTNKRFWYDDPYVDAAGVAISADIASMKTVKETRWARAFTLIQEAVKEPLVQTIVIDGLGALCDMLIDHLILTARLSEGKVLDRLRIQDYQPLQTTMKTLILALRGCGKNIVFTSHQAIDKEETTGKVSYALNIPGRLAQNFPGFFTDVWATTSTNVGGKVKYEIHTKPTGYHVSLGSSFGMPDKLDITDKTPEQIWTELSKYLTTK